MEEQPRTARRRVLKTGSMEFPGQSLPCTVRNISETGAAIEVNSPLWFPDRFVLVIASGNFRRACRIVRRDERQLGIKFEAE